MFTSTTKAVLLFSFHLRLPHYIPQLCYHRSIHAILLLWAPPFPQSTSSHSLPACSRFLSSQRSSASSSAAATGVDAVPLRERCATIPASVRSSAHFACASASVFVSAARVCDAQRYFNLSVVNVNVINKIYITLLVIVKNRRRYILYIYEGLKANS